MQRELRLYPDVETGGVLLGAKMGHIWFVFRVSSSGKRCIRNASSFQSDAAELAEEVEYIQSNSFLPLSVLGLWHKHNHNHSPFFSEDDKKTNAEYAKLNAFGALSIVAAKEENTYVFHAFHVRPGNTYAEETLFDI